MSVLVVGGDRISAIKDILKEYGATSITHWSARGKRAISKKNIPSGTDCVLLLTDFLNHNAMKQFKKEAKSKDIPLLCSKRACSSVSCALCNIFGKSCDGKNV